jgi:hypothetical protein
MQAVQEGKSGPTVKIDVVAIGIDESKAEKLSGVVQACDGVFLRVEQPSEVDAALAQYAELLHVPRLSEVEISGPTGSHKVLPGEEAVLPPGVYSMTLPEIDGLDPLKRTVRNVEIKPGDSLLLDVSIRNGNPIVQGQVF